MCAEKTYRNGKKAMFQNLTSRIISANQKTLFGWIGQSDHFVTNLLLKFQQKICEWAR